MYTGCCIIWLSTLKNFSLTRDTYGDKLDALQYYQRPDTGKLISYNVLMKEEEQTRSLAAFFIYSISKIRCPVYSCVVTAPQLDAYVVWTS